LTCMLNTWRWRLMMLLQFGWYGQEERNRLKHKSKLWIPAFKQLSLMKNSRSIQYLKSIQKLESQRKARFLRWPSSWTRAWEECTWQSKILTCLTSFMENISLWDYIWNKVKPILHIQLIWRRLTLTLVWKVPTKMVLFRKECQLSKTRCPNLYKRPWKIKWNKLLSTVSIRKKILLKNLLIPRKMLMVAIKWWKLNN